MGTERGWGGGIPGDEGIRDCGEHRDFLPDLLGASEWKGSASHGAAGGDHHGTAL